MSNPSRLLAFMGVLLFLLSTVSVRAEYLDPPERVARLSFSQGEVSFSPAGENDWVTVMRNRPLFRGDRLWSDYNALAEFQVGSAAVRLGSNTSVEILNLDDNIAQFQLAEGTLSLTVRRLYPGQIFEVDTPMLAFTISREGRYRIDVDLNNNVTTIQISEGAGVAYGENATFRMIEGDNVRFYDTDLQDYQLTGMPPEDAFDRYCSDRDLRLSRSASLRYLDDDVVGYADLDDYGNWRPVRNYGTVWFPSRVEAGWAPYRDGHWIWQEPWGWTWVDEEPWGFAPSHYGRWVYVGNRWGWVPGPRHVRPVYAPALVAFIGGSNWSLSISTGSPIGWFPLGPREVYVPSYHASRDYFKRVNVNNTVINNTTIVNVYNNYSSGRNGAHEGRHANRSVAGAITAVPRSVFVNAQPVRHAAIHLDRKALTSSEITLNAPVAPNARSVIGAGKETRARPSLRAFDRKVLVRNAPPPGVSSFAAREPLLQKNPGRAPEPDAVRRNASTDRKVRVIGEQPGAVDARAAESRHRGNRPAGQLQLQMDRSTEPGSRSRSRFVPDTGSDVQTRDRVNNSQIDMQQQAEQQQQAERQRKAESKRQAESQQQIERQRQIDMQQQAEQQQQAERQRQIDMQQQQQLQVVPPQQEQRQIQAAPQQQVQAARQKGKAEKRLTPAEKLQAECERLATLQNLDQSQCLSNAQTQENADKLRLDRKRR